MEDNRKLLIESPASGAFPASRLNATIKQIATDQVDEEIIKLMEICFPEMTSYEFDKMTVKKEKPNLVITSDGVFYSDGLRRRRFSGSDLPSNRYFTVCSTEAGSDDGTLCYELFSYWTANSGLFLSLTDFTTHTEALDLAGIEEKDRKPQIQVAISDLVDIDVDDTGNLKHGSDAYIFYLPLRLINIICDNVLDLRMPQAQNWLCETCNRETSLVEYLQFLPNLITPNPGGDAFHYTLANFLRFHGCKGLVFPSARNNVYASADINEVFEHGGWNFVLYNDAPVNFDEEPEIMTSIGGETPESILARIGYSDEVESLREWFVEGVQDREWGRVYFELRSAFGLARRTGNYMHIFNEIRRGYSYTDKNYLSRISKEEIQRMRFNGLSFKPHWQSIMLKRIWGKKGGFQKRILAFFRRGIEKFRKIFIKK